MNAGQIQTLLQARGFVCNRALGQHFLMDDAMIKAIVDGSGIDNTTNVLEIGPGAGVLTSPMAARARKVLAVELDRLLLPVLESVLQGQKNVQVVREDIMKIDIGALVRETLGEGSFDVVSNLPYSITTPVIQRLLDGSLPIRRMTVMVQSEAAVRIMATPGGKEYGPLSILTQYKTKTESILHVPRTCFVPPPHVESTVLVMEMIAPPVELLDEKRFFTLVRSSFAMRRKTLLNNLLGAYRLSREEATIMLTNCGLDDRTRAERVSLAQFAFISNALIDAQK